MYNTMNTIQQLQEGQFEDLKDFELFYKINSKGEVWSNCCLKLMKPQTNEYGYLFYTLRNGPISKCLIHRLLGKQYIQNPNNLPEIDHIDRNRQNNSLANLRWVTRTENQNNKSTNLTEEQKSQRVIEVREYKRVWAENSRREQGIEPKSEKKSDDEIREANKLYAREKRASMTQEEKEVYNAHNRAIRPEPTEERKAAAIVRAQKQRDDIKADPIKTAELKEYKKSKEKEQRENQTPEQKVAANEKSRLWQKARRKQMTPEELAAKSEQRKANYLKAKQLKANNL